MEQLSIFDVMQDEPPKVGDTVISDDYIKGHIVDISEDYIKCVLIDESIHLTPKRAFKYFFKVVKND